MRLIDANLDQRARAARELVRWGRLDGDIALSYVIWPEISPQDALHPFRKIKAELEPDRCAALNRTAVFPTRCGHRAQEDGLCGGHLRLLREGKPVRYYEEASDG